MKGWFCWLHDKSPTCVHVAAKGRQEGTTTPLLTILFLHMQHFILWTKYWIPSLLTAGMMSLRGQMRINHMSKSQTKTGNVSARNKKANTLGYNKTRRSEKIVY